MSNENEKVLTLYRGYYGPLFPGPLDTIQEHMARHHRVFDIDLYREVLKIIKLMNGTQEKMTLHPTTRDKYEWDAAINFTYAGVKTVRHKFLFPKTGVDSHPENTASDRHVAMYLRMEDISLEEIRRYDDATPARLFAGYVKEAVRRRLFERV